MVLDELEEALRVNRGGYRRDVVLVEPQHTRFPVVLHLLGEVVRLEYINNPKEIDDRQGLIPFISGTETPKIFCKCSCPVARAESQSLEYNKR